MIPVFNNAPSLSALINRIESVANLESNYFFEVIMIDDGSLDNSWNVLENIIPQSSNLRIVKIRLTKNSGQMAAILCGLSEMSGQAAIIMSADLQDSPETIHKFLRAVESGSKIVIAQRTQRYDGRLAKLTSALAYFFIRRKYRNFPKGGFDFFYIDFEVCQKLLEMRGRYRYLQPELISLGYHIDSVESIRAPRLHGRSWNTFPKRLNFFLTAMLDFSPNFIRRLASLGIAVVASAVILMAIAIYRRIFGETPFSGFTTLFCVTIFFSGIQIIMLSVVGEYVWRIFDTSRGKPLYIIQKKLN